VTGRARAAAFAVIAFCALFQFFTLRSGHSWMDDAFMYVMHADNLAAGRPYAQTCYAYTPENPYPGPAVYPPGYPVLLAVIMKAGGGFRAFKAANVFFLASLLVCLLFLAGFPPDDLRAAALAGLFGLNPVLWNYKDLVYSDILFCFLLYFSVLVYGRARERRGSLLYAAAGFACYLAYSVRPLGGILPAAIALEAIASGKGRWRDLGVLAACFAVPAAAQAFFFDLSAYSGTLSAHTADALVPGASRVLGGFLTSMLNFWAPDLSRAPAASAAAAALTFAVLAGFTAGLGARISAKRLEAMDFFVPLYVGAVAAFRIYDGVRYLFPLMPYLAWKAFEGFGVFRGEAAGRRASAVFLAGALALYGWTFAARTEYGTISAGPYSKTAQGMFDYLRTASDRDGTVIFIKPRSMCFFTGRRSAVYPASGDDAQFMEYFRKEGASYLVISRIFEQDARSLYGFAERNSRVLEKVYENQDFKVFRILPGRG